MFGIGIFDDFIENGKEIYKSKIKKKNKSKIDFNNI